MIFVAQDLIKQLLSIAGMPKQVTRLLIEFRVDEPVTVTATFFLDTDGPYPILETKRYRLEELHESDRKN